MAAVRVERILADLERLDHFHSGAGTGLTRLAYSPEWRAAQDWATGELERLGLEPTLDAVGNVVGVRRQAGDASAAPVLTGSHLDSVPEGGRYDGALGVVCALEAMRAIQDAGIRTQAPLGVLVTAPEESSRFGIGCLGSRSLSGALSPSRLTTLRDADGITVAQALAACGLDPGSLGLVRKAPGWCQAFLEVHVDQGPLLRDANAPVGAVGVIVVPGKVRVTFTGEASHAGGAPWPLRRDALIGAADLIRAVAEWNAASVDDGTVATVGRLEVAPGSINVVPETATLWIDLRPTSRERRDQWLQRLHDTTAVIVRDRNLKAVTVEPLILGEPVACAPHLQAALQAAAAAAGVPCPTVPSMAGHDAAQLAAITDVGMILVRNAAAISHSPLEAAAPADIAAGCRVLVGALLLAAGLEGVYTGG